jgi:two-component system response regulator
MSDMKVMEQTVLIIDDSRDDSLITERALSKAGRDIRTEVASGGEAALALLHDGRALPALILLDLKMPGMDGLELLQRIRGDERLSHIPVVMLTNSTLEADERAAYKAGANSFVHKSFDLERFYRDVRALLDRWLQR